MRPSPKFQQTPNPVAQSVPELEPLSRYNITINSFLEDKSRDTQQYRRMIGGFDNEIIAKSIDQRKEQDSMLLSKRVIDPKFRTIRGTFDIPLSAMRAEVGFQKPVSNRHELSTVLPQMTLSQPPKLSMECR